jgi:hypothetical protein
MVPMGVSDGVSRRRIWVAVSSFLEICVTSIAIHSEEADKTDSSISVSRGNFCSTWKTWIR